MKAVSTIFESFYRAVKRLLPSGMTKAACCFLWLFSALFSFASATLAAQDYVGSQACVACHTEQFKDWKASQHHSALQEATAKNVLGDFNNKTYQYEGVVSRFFKQGSDLMVETDGPDGKLKPYKVLYTIGDYPLQQYLVDFGKGHIQPLSLAWDSRAVKEGGQRWFHLYPDEKVNFKDPLHWTKITQNANQMCIECHTTDYKRNYQPEDHSYTTDWAESGVGCESCHGPASKHLEWAENPKDTISNKGFIVDLSDQVKWVWDKDSDIARPLEVKAQQQVETCGQCHSRREQIASKPAVNKVMTDNFMPSLLTNVLYEADGQINDEVFVYGSFKQSKMFEAGVTCSNCHNPHSGKLKAEGNQVCAQCHSPKEFDTPKHTFHEPKSPGAQCSSCHMPEKTYMVVDPRKDHSFRIPRPDLSAKLGTSNACVQCHTDKSNEWAANTMDSWHGKEWRQRPEFATAFHAARTGAYNAGEQLRAIAESQEFAPIVRATALNEMGNYLNGDLLPTVQRNLKDNDPLVRSAAVASLQIAPANIRVQLLAPLMDDPSKAVRLEVARLMASVPDQQLTPAQQNQKQMLTSEYVTTQRLSSDRAGGRLNLGQFYLDLGMAYKAEAEFLKAAEIEPYFTPVYTNLSEFYRRTAQPQKENEWLKKGLEVDGSSAALNHSMGLYLVRQKRTGESTSFLRKAVELEPTNERYVYVYGVALFSVGKKAEAVEVLDKALQQFPANRQIEQALRGYRQKMQQ
ncbi:cytochrome c3 family protein [Endozoicomonas arenosclerae]|uniref:cytochrome c3 family protein n=1 Tax=Endozoicomonas arenosclerae TaxID=1633495 RepID=UPI000785D5A5|nr:multiheme c-type cytochrome [Endozoicomonas arenosclerae]